MKPNHSTFERSVRFLLGLLLATIVATQAEFGLSEGALLVVASFLLLNGLSGRCYLWRWLGLNTARNNIELCNRSSRRNTDAQH